MERQPEVSAAMAKFNSVLQCWLQGGAKETARDTPIQVTLERLCCGTEAHTPRSSHQEIHSDCGWMRANDPSAGSPTETLLRLLLPLSDKVH